MAKKKTIRKKRKSASASKKKTSTRKKVKKEKSNMITFIGIVAVLVIIIFAAKYYAPKTELTGTVMAVVNNQPIYEEEFKQEMNRLPPELQGTMNNNTILSQLIDKKLLVEEANKVGVSADKEINNILTTNNITLDNLTMIVNEQGFTIEEFKEQIQIALFLNETLFSKLTVSDEEVIKYYEKNPQLFIIPENVIARHILVSLTNRTDEEAQALINEIKTTIDADNSKFCELVISYSEDTGSISNCGEYPAFTRDDPYVQEYKDAAFNNAVGESSIALTDFGYHLVQTIEKNSETMMPLESVAPQVENNLMFEKQKESFTNYITGVKSTAEIINCLETPENELCSPVTGTKDDQSDEEVAIAEETELSSFAKCLSEKGTKMYGTYLCSHCQAQKSMFGDAWKEITYIECLLEGDTSKQTSACAEAGIKGYPTWEINGRQYTGEHTLKKLSTLSGCEL